MNVCHQDFPVRKRSLQIGVLHVAWWSKISVPWPWILGASYACLLVPNCTSFWVILDTFGNFTCQRRFVLFLEVCESSDVKICRQQEWIRLTDVSLDEPSPARQSAFSDPVRLDSYIVKVKIGKSLPPKNPQVHVWENECKARKDAVHSEVWDVICLLCFQSLQHT